MKTVFCSLTCPTSRLTVWCEQARNFIKLEMYGNQPAYDLIDNYYNMEVHVEGMITLATVMEHIEQLNGWKRTDYVIKYWNPRLDAKAKSRKVKNVSKKN